MNKAELGPRASAMRPARRSLVELTLAAAKSAGLETRASAQPTAKLQALDVTQADKRLSDPKRGRANRRSSDRGRSKRRPVQDGTASSHAALDAVRQLHFGTMDALRRLQGNALAAVGLGPDECPSTVIASTPLWRLRDYGGHDAASPLLIVAAPIKRPYIWDLAPSVSAIRFCLQ